MKADDDELRDLVSRHPRICALMTAGLAERLSAVVRAASTSGGDETPKLQGRIACLLEMQREWFFPAQR